MKNGSMKEADAEYLPLSYLSQADYCLRRAALLMNEQVWLESADTAKGRSEHERVHTQRVERRGSQIKLYEYNVFSDELRISGKCDCIEASESEDGCILPVAEFPLRLYPVEYKHGQVRDEREYNIQLCAEAMCLEEMYQTKISEGAIFYISSHKRQRVLFGEDLRSLVKETANSLRAIRTGLFIPPPQMGPKCSRCSLKEYCLPDLKRSAEAFCRKLADEAKEIQEI